MSLDSLKRPALGQSAALGTLYDARTDEFLPSTILRGHFLPEAVTTSEISNCRIKISDDESYKERFADMGLSSDLSTSFLAGLVDVSGSGRFLVEQQSTHVSVQRHLSYTIETVHQSLNFAGGDMKQFLDLKSLSAGSATHIVSEINWGAQCVVSARRRIAEDEYKGLAVASLESIFRKFEDIAMPAKLTNERHPEHPEGFDSFSYSIYSDISTTQDRGSEKERTFQDIGDAQGSKTGSPNSQDFESVCSYLRQMPKHVEAHKNGSGVPISYTLLPLRFIAVFFGAPLSLLAPVGQLSTDLQERYIDILDAQRRALQSLNSHYEKLEGYRFCIPGTHLAAVSDRIRAARKAEDVFRNHYGICVKLLRHGKGDPREVSKLCDGFLRSDCAPEKLIALSSKHVEKLKFVEMVQRRGGRYLGYGEPSTEAAIRMQPHGNTFMFHFKEEMLSSGETWEANEALLLETLDKHQYDTNIWIVDADARGLTLEKPYMSRLTNGDLITPDVLEAQKLVAGKCLMRYDEAALDATAVTMPSQRRPMRVACPGAQCDPNTRCDWICSKCHLAIEYGKVDNFLYCDCGRAAINRWSYKCKNLIHGESFVAYGRHELREELKGLPPRTELNVLILGETGVGKSTFINAFINYLAFPSLDEGMLGEELNCIIPCSFSTQELDAYGKLVKKEVRIGADRDERDGRTGQSATQKTMVYPLFVGNYMVRLIDTPGIGDTRGIEQDKKNFVDVLSVLRNYEKLHGILILLKPNASRLTVMFRFCVEELLTHLHRSAATNMAFGFTNTRGSNYRPGDTFDPLEVHLSKYKDVIPGLFNDNVYCFDSESFRYLAARKQGVDMGNIEDYRRSWQHSANEAQRLLAHFAGLNPHHVRSTLSLNETRYLIEQLIAPMAQISKTITQSIAVNEADARALSDIRLDGQALLAKLNTQKLTLTARQLIQPKTACSNEKCVTVHRPSGMDSDDMQILYTTLCHNPCCLTDVPANSIGTKELRNCWAFAPDSGDRTGHRQPCRTCGHGWKEHLHIVVEYEETATTVADPAVQLALTQNGSIVQAKEAALQAKHTLVAELQSEHSQIQEAQARFTIYLRSISITPYNDATLEYYDHLIKEEKSKVGFGASRARLEGLERYRHQYEAFVDAMTKKATTKKGKQSYRALDAEGVYRLVEKLYSLKHNGQDLRKIASVVQMAYAATFREKVYRIKGRNYRMIAPLAGRSSQQHAFIRPLVGQQGRQRIRALQKLRPMFPCWHAGSKQPPGALAKETQLRGQSGGYGQGQKIQQQRPKGPLLLSVSGSENDGISPPPYEARPTVIRPLGISNASARNEDEVKRSSWLGGKMRKFRRKSGVNDDNDNNDDKARSEWM